MPLCLTVFAGRENSRHMADVGSGLRWEGKAVASGAQIGLQLKMINNASMRATGNGRRWGSLRGIRFILVSPSARNRRRPSEAGWVNGAEGMFRPNNCVLANL